MEAIRLAHRRPFQITRALCFVIVQTLSRQVCLDVEAMAMQCLLRTWLVQVGHCLKAVFSLYSNIIIPLTYCSLPCNLLMQPCTKVICNTLNCQDHALRL